MTHCAICRMAGIETIATQHNGDMALCDDCHMTLEKSNFDLEKWADAHQCSIEVAEGILAVATSFEEMERIWQDPTEDQVIFVWNYATAFEAVDDTFMDWGYTTLARMRADLDV